MFWVHVVALAQPYATANFTCKIGHSKTLLFGFATNEVVNDFQTFGTDTDFIFSACLINVDEMLGYAMN